ncbi:hypothetical protein [Pseudomarimonas arenosa]|uniref:ATPase n=1 Tax=Pseudomarimonas arenosa TaxID=2774145 RepID=A0AAW3ZQL3_9GAMM|nr:hypothetical protein [Pseudomarimonas arenosa]MBD8526919.1 hypothetical protein [Pseudomarimonas arenosa]
MSRTQRMGLAIGLSLCSYSAQAEVQQLSAAGFAVRHEALLRADQASIFQTLIHPAGWWHPDHTWSGDASNLSLELRAGGCFCERWPQGEAEHMRVGYFTHNTQLRLLGGLGPLQSMALSGALQFDIKATEAGQQLSLSYRVSGDPAHQLEALAPVVDKVLAEQFTRLVRKIETGAADAPTAPEQ